jgi:hypothetical protein
MAEVRLTMAEYEALLEASQRVDSGQRIPLRKNDHLGPRKRKGTPLRGMASALKKANAKARKKNGSFKKGWSQARVMKEAHRIRRRG